MGKAKAILTQIQDLELNDVINLNQEILKYLKGYPASIQLAVLGSSLVYLLDRYNIKAENVLTEGDRIVYSNQYCNLSDSLMQLQSYVYKESKN